jgi:hypothetical protein
LSNFVVRKTSSRDAGGADARAGPGLVAVPLRGVEQPVAGGDRIRDDALGLRIVHRPGAEP